MAFPNNHFLFFLMAGVLALACAHRGTDGATPKDGQAAPEVVTQTEVEWAELPAVHGGGPSEALEILIHSQDEWCQFWKIRKEYQTPSPPCETPEGMDWKKYSLGVVALGMRSNGCFGVRIADVRREGQDAVVVKAQETRRVPGPCTMAIVYPAAVIRMPAWVKTMKVEHEKIDISMKAPS